MLRYIRVFSSERFCKMLQEMRLHLTNYYNSRQFTLQCDYYAYHRLLFMSKIIIFFGNKLYIKDVLQLKMEIFSIINCP
jgi:hypothetical protein